MAKKFHNIRGLCEQWIDLLIKEHDNMKTSMNRILKSLSIFGVNKRNLDLEKDIGGFPSIRESRLNDCLMESIRKARMWTEGVQLSAEDENVASQVFSWTGKYYAPGLEKPLDALIARHIIRRYFKSGLILDMGCGAGRMADAVFGDIVSTACIDGLDKELEKESSLKAFREYSWSRKAIHCDFSATGEEHDSYDIVFSNNALHIADDLASALHEVHRILKPGGILVFNGYTPTHASILAEMNKRLETFDMQEFAEGISSRRLPRYYTKATMREWLHDGWTNLECYQYLTGPYAEMYYLLYLPYSLYWRYETDIKNCPAAYRKMKTMFDNQLQTLVIKSLPEQVKLSMGKDGQGSKIYLVARKAPV